MSDVTYQTQNPWDETPEEYNRRCREGGNSNNGWITTAVSILLGVVGLGLLFTL